MLFVLGAFLCAGLGQWTMSADAAPMAGLTMTMDSGGGMPMPCKSSLPNCVSDIGCIFMVALPAAFVPTMTQLTWSRLTYQNTISVLAGRSLEPAIGPPIAV